MEEEVKHASAYVKLKKDQVPLEDITPGEINQPVDVPQLHVQKCNECGQPLPESYRAPADEPWSTGIFACTQDTESCSQCTMDGKHGHSPNIKLRPDTVNRFGHRKSRNPWSALKAWLLCITHFCSWRGGYPSVKQRLDLQSLVMEPIIVMAMDPSLCLI